MEENESENSENNVKETDVIKNEESFSSLTTEESHKQENVISKDKTF
jgi:hypothetical protein